MGGMGGRVVVGRVGTGGPRYQDEGPEGDVGAENVRAPGEDQPGVAELLRFGAVAHAECLRQTDTAGRRADGAVEPRGAKAGEGAAIHAAAVESSHPSGSATGPHGSRAQLLFPRAQPSGY